MNRRRHYEEVQKNQAPPAQPEIPTQEVQAEPQTQTAPVEENISPQEVEEQREIPAQPLQEKPKSKKQNSMETAKQMLIEQANQAAYRLNMETTPKADAEKNKVPTPPTSKKTYHFDGTQNIESEEILYPVLTALEDADIQFIGWESDVNEKG